MFSIPKLLYTNVNSLAIEGSIQMHIGCHKLLPETDSLSPK